MNAGEPPEDISCAMGGWLVEPVGAWPEDPADGWLAPPEEPAEGDGTWLFGLPVTLAGVRHLV